MFCGAQSDGVQRSHRNQDGALKKLGIDGFKPETEKTNVANGTGANGTGANGTGANGTGANVKNVDHRLVAEVGTHVNKSRPLPGNSATGPGAGRRKVGTKPHSVKTAKDKAGTVANRTVANRTVANGTAAKKKPAAKEKPAAKKKIMKNVSYRLLGNFATGPGAGRRTVHTKPHSAKATKDKTVRGEFRTTMKHAKDMLVCSAFSKDTQQKHNCLLRTH